MLASMTTFSEQFPPVEQPVQYQEIHSAFQAPSHDLVVDGGITQLVVVRLL
jgi:hypothetical protein